MVSAMIIIHQKIPVDDKNPEIRCVIFVVKIVHASFHIFLLPCKDTSTTSFLDFGSLSVDDLIKCSVEVCEGGFLCKICEKKISRKDHLRRHMRNIHLSSDKDYQCPPCNKYFKNRAMIYNHIFKYHQDWKGVCYDDFATKKIKTERND